MFQLNKIFIGLIITASCSTTFAKQRLAFQWSDINTRDVLRWDGDTAVVRQGSSTLELSCKIKINEQDVQRAIDSFGIPNQWTSISYHDENELLQKQRNLKDKASKNGIKMMQDGNRFIVDYSWVVSNSVQDVRDVARAIRSEARREGYRSTRELVGAFASFAQSLPYRIPPDSRINDDGEKILTAGAMMPLDTLTKQWGDCDSKSMLFAALVQSINLVDVCFITMNEHLFAAVKLAPNRDDHAIRYKGRNWVLIELTDAWPLGRIPADHLDGIDSGNYSVVELN